MDALSRPSRARGLKLGEAAVEALVAVSRPSRARGLKLAGNGWNVEFMRSRPSRARGLKRRAGRPRRPHRRRAPRGRVD